MTAHLAIRSATVRSPATSANLGPGFDCLGIALDLWDEYAVELGTGPGVTVASTGEGAADLPDDESHLVARALRRGLAAAGVEQVGFRLRCRNRIPHRRGLGSSSAAIVGGLSLAAALAPGPALVPAAIVALATELEGHPDNVAAAVLGGATIAWIDETGAGRAVGSQVAPALPATVLVPSSETETEAARGLLPASVPYGDAVFNVSRAALLVHALGHAPDLIFDATEDRLHQQYRHSAYPASLRLVQQLRSAKVASAISGAGPTVLAFAQPADVAGLAPVGWNVLPLGITGLGAHTVTTD